MDAWTAKYSKYALSHALFLSLSLPISLFNIGIVAWFICYMIIGSTAAPGGRLFGLVVLTVAANFGGFLVSLINLPRLIGMLATGILFQVCSHSCALEKALENCVGHICTCFVWCVFASKTPNKWMGNLGYMNPSIHIFFVPFSVLFHRLIFNIGSLRWIINSIV